MSVRMGLMRTVIQWTKGIIGVALMLAATVALADYLSGGDDIAGVGLPLLFVFVFVARAYGDYLGLTN